MQSPVALELLELLATTNIPQADRLVIRRTHEKLRIRGAELDATDVIAAILVNVRFLVNFSTPLPRYRGKQATLRKGGSPIRSHLPSATLHSLTVLSNDPLTSCPTSLGLNWTQ